MAPASWFNFIGLTDVVVKGEVVSAKQVTSGSGARYVKLEIDVESKILLNDEPMELDKEISIYLGGHSNPINVGKQGYFFVTKTFGKWLILDADIGLWELVKIWTVNLNGEAAKFRAAPNAFEFPFSILNDPPDMLREKLRYIDYAISDTAIVEKVFFTEDRLLSYLNSKPCRLENKMATQIDKNISNYMKSKYRTRAGFPKFLSFKDIGSACVFRQIEDRTAGYTRVLLVDKNSSLIIDDVGIEIRGAREEHLRQNKMWAIYKSDFDSLD